MIKKTSISSVTSPAEIAPYQSAIMEALRAAIAAAQRAGTLLKMAFHGRERDWVHKRLDELEGFSEICDQIHLNPVLGRDRDTGASLKRCTDNVSDIQVLLEEIRSFKKDHTSRDSWKSIVSKDMEEEIIRLFNRLQREKASLELQIAAAISYVKSHDHVMTEGLTALQRCPVSNGRRA